MQKGEGKPIRKFTYKLIENKGCCPCHQKEGDSFTITRYRHGDLLCLQKGEGICAWHLSGLLTGVPASLHIVNTEKEKDKDWMAGWKPSIGLQYCSVCGNIWEITTEEVEEEVKE